MNFRQKLVAIFAALLIIPSLAFAARTDGLWDFVNGVYSPNGSANGADLLLKGSNHYLNFGSASGINGYGIRDSAGTMEYKNSGGSWAAIGSGGGGGSGSGTISTSTVIVVDTPAYFNSASTIASASLNSPLSFSGGTFSISQANAVQAGYLTSSDWNSFNARLSTSTLALFDKGYFFSTTSASYFSSLGLAFSTTSADAWFATKSVTGFSTTSANYWSSVGLGFSTTSASYFLSQNQGAAFSTTSADYYMQNSSTVPTTFKLNTFTAQNVFTGGASSSNSTTTGTLYLSRLAGNAAGTLLAVDPSGNVISTSSTAGGVTSVTASAPIFSSGGATPNLSWAGLATTSQPSASQLLVSNGGAGVYGVSTSTCTINSPLTGSLTSIGTCSLSINQATTGQNGYLSSTDFGTFNNKVSSSSLSAVAPIFYNSATGVFSWAGLATTSQPASSNILVSNGAAGVYGVATSSGTVSSPLTGNLTCIGSCSLGIQQGTATQNGYISSTDWNAFNARLSSSTVTQIDHGQFFSTTSASFFSSVGLAYSTTSTLADLTTYNKGFFFSTTSSSAFSAVGLAFSTTSANFWSSVGLGFSTTSASYFLTQNQGNAFSTTSANYHASVGLAHSTTSVAYQLSQNVTLGNATATAFFAATFNATNASSSALTISGLGSGSTQCLQISGSGVVSGTGSACGGSGSTPGGTGSELQFRGGASTFSALSNSAVSGPYLGLGTTTPYGLLTLATSTSGQLFLGTGVGAQTYFGFRVMSDNSLTIATTSGASTNFSTTSNSSVFSLSQKGSLCIGIGCTAPAFSSGLVLRDQDGTGPDLAMGGNDGGDSDCHLYRVANNNGISDDPFSFGCSGSVNTKPTIPIMTWSPQNNRVGIGTSTPNAKLAVVATSTELASPLFLVATSSATTDELFSISTSSAFNALSDLALSALTNFRNAVVVTIGQRLALPFDNFVINGTYSSTWTNIACDDFGNTSISANTPGICGWLTFSRATAGSFTGTFTSSTDAPAGLITVTAGTGVDFSQIAGNAISGATLATTTPKMDFVIVPGSASTYSTTTVREAGFTDSSGGLTGSAADACVVYATSTTNYQYLCRSAVSNTTQVDSGIPTSSAARFRIELDGSRAIFYGKASLYSAFAAPTIITTNLPDSGSLLPGALVARNTGGSSVAPNWIVGNIHYQRKNTWYQIN